MKIAVCVAALVIGCSRASGAQLADAMAPALDSGIELQYVDTSVRPQDDFYRFVNGKWLESAVIPPDKGRYSSFDILRDRTLDQLHALIEDVLKDSDPADPDQRKIVDLYSGFLDEGSLEGKGIAPLRFELARVDALSEVSQIAGLMAHLSRIGVSMPFISTVRPDDKDSTRYAVSLSQGGLGLPDRDFYLLDAARLKTVREKYPKHIERMLQIAGDADAAVKAQAVLQLETDLARAQWSRVDNRDPVKTYNHVETRNLTSLAPGFEWTAYMEESGYAGKADYVLVRQPSYIKTLDSLIAKHSLSDWKAYFRFRVLSAFAPYLEKRFVDEDFAFNGTIVQGIPENLPRWKRGLNLLDSSIGEAVGRLYVARYFPPQAKARMDHLVSNLLAAYRADIDTLTWMGPETRKKAQEKLSAFTPKIGYPSAWRNYSALRIERGDLVGNVMRARSFEHDRKAGQLGKRVDRAEWRMTPQTVNAYYDQSMNEIVFPAAILQPPFFNAQADDAVNYGAIGAVIGHEISHGFDDQGSQYDKDGNLVGRPGWFTQEDYERYHATTHSLVDQYNAQEPLPGYHVNGELTLGENIADNSGLAIAYKAYKSSLVGKPSRVIAGYRGEQRFYMGWAQIWREKIRDERLVVQLKSDPHSPGEVRAQVPLRNQAGFYEAFGVKATDKMFLPPEQRVTIW